MNNVLTAEQIIDELIALDARKSQLIAAWNEFKNQQIKTLSDKNAMLEKAINDTKDPHKRQ
jgi:hypothetical protein